MIVYHVNREDVKECMKKNIESDSYIWAKKYWGNIVIYEKSERNEKKFAYLFDPKGVICHCITQEMYRMLTKELPKSQHVYKRGITDAEVTHIKALVKKMNERELDQFQDWLEDFYEGGCECLNS